MATAAVRTCPMGPAFPANDGRWFTRSLNRDNKHYLSHVGTAFAVMALAECGK